MANEDRLIEMADEIVAAMVDEGIRKSREGLRKEPPEGYDGTCPSCGADVPPRRQELGYYNCVDCQEINEARRKRGLPPL